MNEKENDNPETFTQYYWAGPEYSDKEKEYLKNLRLISYFKIVKFVLLFILFILFAI